MTNDKQAESAARKIWEKYRMVDSGDVINQIQVELFASVISAEYEPVMEVLRDLSRMPVESALEAGAPPSIKMGMLSIVLHLKRRAQEIVGEG